MGLRRFFVHLHKQIKQIMKKLALALAAALFGLGAFAAEPLKIMSYNIRNGLGLDKITDYGRVGRCIAAEAPDFVAIQEVDSATVRSKGACVLDSIADAAGMYSVFGPAIRFGGGRYGVGILSRKEPLSTYNVPLPGTEEKRTLLIAEFDDIVFACTHLSLTEADRLASVPIIEVEMAKTDKPFIICGDWNSKPGDATLTELGRFLTVVTDPKAPTFPANLPLSVIDYIAVGNAVPQVLSTAVVNEPVASDHRPVTAVLCLPAISVQE